MANFNNQPNKTSAGMNIQQVSNRMLNLLKGRGAYGTEFASETNAQQVRQQNAQSAKQPSLKAASLLKVHLAQSSQVKQMLLK